MAKLLGFNFLIMSVFNFAHPVTPDMLLDKDAPLYLNGILYSLMSLSMFLFSPYWGNKADLKGPKKIMVFSPLGYGIMQQVMAFAPGSFGMGLGRFAAGFFSAGWIVALTLYVNMISKPEDRAKNFGYIMVTNGLAGICGQLFAGYIGAPGGIYTYIPFVLQLVFAAILSVLVYFTLADKKPEQVQERVKVTMKSSLRLVKKREIGSLIFVMVTLSVASNIYSSHIGYFMSEVHGYSPQQISYVNSFGSLVTLLMNLFAISYIKKKIGVIRGIKLEFVFGLLAFVMALVLPMHYIIICIGVYIAATSIYRPLVQHFILTQNSDNAGEMMGVVNSFNSLGMILGSLSSGFLFTFGANVPFYAIVVVLGAGLLVFRLKVAKSAKI